MKYQYAKNGYEFFHMANMAEKTTREMEGSLPNRSKHGKRTRLTKEEARFFRRLYRRYGKGV